MTKTQQWVVGQLGVLVAFVGFVAQALIQGGTALLALPWSQAGPEGWVVWSFSGVAIGTAIQLIQFFRGKLDLSCHRMPWEMDRWVYPMIAVVGPLAGLTSLVLLALEAGS